MEFNEFFKINALGKNVKVTTKDGIEYAGVLECIDMYCNVILKNIVPDETKGYLKAL